MRLNGQLGILKRTDKMKKRPLSSNITPSNHGFTLFELCIVIILVGTVIAVVSTAYQNYQIEKRVQSTKEIVAQLPEKLNDYRKVHGHYPRPASLSSDRNDATYGFAQTGAFPAAGACSNGYCTQNSARPGMGTVLIGAVPFRELNLPEENSYDAYGSRLVYGVTDTLTSESTFNEAAGGISVVDENGNDLFQPNASGHFIVFSPGKDKLGAYGLNGKIVTTCPTGAAAANCNFLTGASSAIFRTASLASGGILLDDVLAFHANTEREMWRRSTDPSNPDDLIDMSNGKVFMTSRRSVGAADAAMNILYDGSNDKYDGSLYVRGKLQGKQFCDNDGLNCFDLTKVAKICSNPGEYVIGIYDGEIQCDTIYFGCGENMYLSGVKSNGEPECTPIPLAPVNGSCGSAGGKQLKSIPTSGTLCQAGDESAITTQNTNPPSWTWTCQGQNGGTNVNCSAQLQTPINGSCGGDARSNLTSPPTAYCNQGTMQDMSGSGPWRWTCKGDGEGSTDATCNASLAPVVVPPPYCAAGTSGACGSSINTCASGTLQDVADTSTTYLWNCNGTYGGSSLSCALARPAPVNGACGSTNNDCTAGTLADVADSSTQYLWNCNGLNGGSSANCSANIPVTYTYAWQQSGFGSCSATCGGGAQTQTVTCMRSDGAAASDSLCSGTKPATSQACNTQACGSQCTWVATTSAGYAPPCGVGSYSTAYSGGACDTYGSSCATGGAWLMCRNMVTGGTSCAPAANTCTNNSVWEISSWDNDGGTWEEDTQSCGWTYKGQSGTYINCNSYVASYPTLGSLVGYLSDGTAVRLGPPKPGCSGDPTTPCQFYLYTGTASTPRPTAAQCQVN